MHARHLITGLVAVAIGMGAAAGTAFADPPATADPTPMTVTSPYGPVDVTVLDAAGDGYTFTLPAGAQRDIPTEASGNSRVLFARDGAFLGEYPLLNPDLHSFCEVRPVTEDPPLSCGVII